MLTTYIFDELAVLVTAMRFANLEEGDEHGVRLEVRLLGSEPHRGSLSASQRIVIDEPVWRADVFEAVEGPAGSLNRAHFHPAFHGAEPVDRHWDETLQSRPTDWLHRQLSDLEGLFAVAGKADRVPGERARAELRAALPGLLADVERQLAAVRSQSPVAS